VREGETIVQLEIKVTGLLISQRISRDYRNMGKMSSLQNVAKELLPGRKLTSSHIVNLAFLKITFALKWA
jgi:hypothetical protein